MADDGWKGGTDPQAYVDSLKMEALTMVEQELKPTLGALTEQEREQVESQLYWVPCPHCKGDAVNYTGGRFCEVCGNSGRVLQSTANVLNSFVPFYVAAEARGMEAAFTMIPEMGRKIEAERLREARSWGGPTMYTPLNLDELITAIRAALNGGQHE